MQAIGAIAAACVFVLAMLLANAQSPTTDGAAEHGTAADVLKFGNNHCDIAFGGSSLSFGYVWQIGSYLIQHTWWDVYELELGHHALGKVTGGEHAVVVRIQVRTPYHSLITLASKQCFVD